VIDVVDNSSPNMIQNRPLRVSELSSSPDSALLTLVSSGSDVTKFHDSGALGFPFRQSCRDENVTRIAI